MNVLITGGAGNLSQELAAYLSKDHQIRLTEIVDVQTNFEFVKSDLGHDEKTNELVRGMDAIIHMAELPPSASDDSERLQMDFLTRCTYNLMWAAMEEGVKKAIYTSTLKLFHKYDEDLTVNENWKPLPSTDPYILGKHLGEFICKEFARTADIDIICLILGKVVREDEVRGEPFDSTWVEIKDAVHAFDCALNADLPKFNSEWSVFHIQAESPSSRFCVARAKGSIGYNPKFNFEG